MPIIRVHSTKNYTVMSNFHLRDKNLTYKAKGMLSFMLSLPEDWDYSVNGLVSVSKENENAIKGILQELKDNGYLVIKKIKDDKGKFIYEYNIYEIPTTINPEGEKPEVDNPEVELPQVDDPEVENQPQINTNIINTKIINTNKQLLNNNNSTSSSSNTINNSSSIYDYIQDNFGRILSSIEIEEISTWEDNELTRYAIKQAVLNSKYNIRYISRILFNYEKQNIKTVQEAQQREEEFKGYKNKSDVVDNLSKLQKAGKPEWLGKEIEVNEATPEEMAELEKQIEELRNG